MKKLYLMFSNRTHIERYSYKIESKREGDYRLFFFNFNYVFLFF